jgi:hypothetical protein
VCVLCVPGAGALERAGARAGSPVGWFEVLDRTWELETGNLDWDRGCVVLCVMWVRMIATPNGVWFRVRAGSRCHGERSVGGADVGREERGLWREWWLMVTAVVDSWEAWFFG